MARLVAEVVFRRGDSAAMAAAPDSVIPMDRETALLLLRLRREVRDAGGELVVMAIPYRDHMSVGATDALWRGLTRFLAENSLQFLDLRPAFVSATREGQTLYFRVDSHWNARGHTLAADCSANTSG